MTDPLISFVYLCGPRDYRLVSLTTERVSWCFYERKRRAHLREVMAPTDIEGMMWGPTVEVRCASCGHPDADCFPGTWREWE